MHCNRPVSPYVAALLTAFCCAPAIAAPPTQRPGASPAPDDGLAAASHQPGLQQERAGILARLGADRWHRAGYRGKGVKVAVLDTGFRGWRSHLGKDLPDHIAARSFRADGNLEFRDSQHGILCGEVVHTLAPQAELLFANWEPGHLDQFLSAVHWAKDQGARIVSVSVIAPTWSDGEGGGLVHRALAEILGPVDSPASVMCFASAGNTTDRHWTGHFHGGGDGWHHWKGDQTDNGLRPWGDDEIAVELYGKHGGSYELTVSDADSGEQAGKAATDATLIDRLSAAVRFAPKLGHHYKVRVRHVAGPEGDFHITTTFASLDYTTPGANVCFPADGDEVVALGAVDTAGRRQIYSACGTNLAHTKPDLVAVVPFPSSWRPRPFGGTSAAAPQAAALAALCLSRHPGWGARQVREALRTSAVDLAAPGPDAETGYGLIHLPPK